MTTRRDVQLASSHRAGDLTGPMGATGATGAAGGRRRRWRGASLLVLLAGNVMLGGCYSYTRYDAPTNGAVANQPQRVALDLTDRGRAELADSLGPGVVRIEGRLVGLTAEAYQLNVTSVRYLRGDPVRWSGEPFAVPRAYVATSHERRFNRTRTLLSAAAVVGGALALLLSVDLFGRGSEDPGRQPGGGPGGTL